MNLAYVRVSIILRYSLRSFWLYGPGVFTVLLSYYLLTNLTQGQDVVMKMGEGTGAIGGLIAVVVWAFFVWYSSRIIGYEKRFKDPHWPKKVLSAFPRMLAVNAYLSMQAAIVALPTNHALTFGWLLLLITLHNAYYFLLFFLFAKKIEKRVALWWSVAMALALGYIVFLLIPLRWDASTHELWLPFVAVGLFIAQVLSLRWFIYRRTRIDKNSDKGLDPRAKASLRFLGIPLVRIPAWFLKTEETTFRVFNIVALVAIGMYAAVLNSVYLAGLVGPLGVVLLAFGLLAGGFNQITTMSIRSGVNVLAILLVVAIFMGMGFDSYKVKLTKRSAAYTFDQRPHLDEYFRKWVQHRESAIKNYEGGYPVYFVLSDGGASRSGYWAASVLDVWARMYPQGDALNDHLFCLSGASGGGVGNAAFYAQLKVKSGDSNASRFLEEDYLSFLAAHMLGTDLLNHVLPIKFNDRGNALADNMAQASAKTMDTLFAGNWETVVDTTGKFPLLYLNTTRVQDGMPAVVSTVQLKSFSERVDVLKLLDCEEKSFTLATAAVLGARFPYVSPAGTINRQQFVDGGYFDNSGSGIVQETLYALNDLRDNEPDTVKKTLYYKLRFHVVHITNSPLGGGAGEPMHPLVNDLAAPLMTVFNTYATQTEVNDARLRLYLEDKGCTDCYTNINLYTHANGQDFPMNWVISEYRLGKMKEQVDSVRSDELKKLFRTTYK